MNNKEQLSEDVKGLIQSCLVDEIDRWINQLDKSGIGLIEDYIKANEEGRKYLIVYAVLVAMCGRCADGLKPSKTSRTFNKMVKNIRYFI